MDFDENFEKLRTDLEIGNISVFDLTEEQSMKLMDYYRKEVQNNQADIENTKKKIRDIKKKIDNLV